MKRTTSKVDHSRAQAITRRHDEQTARNDRSTSVIVGHPENDSSIAGCEQLPIAMNQAGVSHRSAVVLCAEPSRIDKRQIARDRDARSGDIAEAIIWREYDAPGAG